MRKFCSLCLLFLPIILQSEEKTHAFGHHPKLSHFKTFIGGSYVGKIENSKLQGEMLEKCSWRAALNGAAVRMVCEVNEGEYVTEGLINWDPVEKSLVGWFFSSSGSVTKKYIKTSSNRIDIIEDVSSNGNSITKIKTSYTINHLGDLVSATQYLMQGIWVGGSEIAYKKL